MSSRSQSAATSRSVSGEQTLVTRSSRQIRSLPADPRVLDDVAVQPPGGGETQLVRGRGAAEVIDYSADFADGSRIFDVVLDIGGATPIKRLRRALGTTGTLIIVGGESSAPWSPGLAAGCTRRCRARS